MILRGDKLVTFVTVIVDATVQAGAIVATLRVFYFGEEGELHKIERDIRLEEMFLFLFEYEKRLIADRYQQVSEERIDRPDEKAWKLCRLYKPAPSVAGLH